MPTLRPQNAEQQHQMRPWIAEENSVSNRRLWKKRPQNAERRTAARLKGPVWPPGMPNNPCSPSAPRKPMNLCGNLATHLAEGGRTATPVQPRHDSPLLRRTE